MSSPRLPSSAPLQAPLTGGNALPSAISPTLQSLESVGLQSNVGPVLDTTQMSQTSARTANSKQQAQIAAYPLTASPADRSLRHAHNRAFVLQRYNYRLQAMPAADRTAMRALVAKAGTPASRLMLERAIASNHSVAEVKAFATKLGHIERADFKSAGITKPPMPTYLQSLPDAEQRVLAACSLDHLQQSFTASCNVTCSQVVRAHLDPVYGLAGNSHPRILITEQDRLMRNAGAIPIVHHSVEKVEESGTDLEDMAKVLNKQNLGVKYHELPVANTDGDGSRSAVAKARSARQAAFSHLFNIAESGVPTHIGVVFLDAKHKSNGEHALAVLGSRTLSDGRRQLLIHDPEKVEPKDWHPMTNWAKASKDPQGEWIDEKLMVDQGSLGPLDEGPAPNGGPGKFRAELNSYLDATWPGHAPGVAVQTAHAAPKQ